MSTKLTASPWHLDEPNKFVLLTQLNAPFTSPFTVNKPSDAHLLAAAPEMLELLRKMTPLLERCLGEPCLGWRHNDATDAVIAVDALFARLHEEKP